MISVTESLDLMVSDAGCHLTLSRSVLSSHCSSNLSARFERLMQL